MNCGILTFHRAYNYGAVLQCYALTRKLRSLGCNCQVIDYWPQYFQNEYYVQRPFRWTHPPVKTWIRHIRVSKILRSRNSGFESFLQNNIPMTQKTYRSVKELGEDTLEFDCFLTGSDQVWNDACAKMDPVFFLDFPGIGEKKKYSYAASFGFPQIPEGKREIYQKCLTGYCAYCVREDAGARILKDLLGVESMVCCDPTLLLTRQQWDEIASAGTEDSPYILVYYVTRTEKLLAAAAQLAKEKNCKVIALPCNMDIDVLRGNREKAYGFDARPDASPEEFLRLFRDATYVLTNSFHGTVFSILYHKSFAVQIELENGKHNQRAESLLQVTGLEDCILGDGKKISFQLPDWETVEQNLTQLRRQAESYLLDVFSVGSMEVSK